MLNELYLYIKNNFDSEIQQFIKVNYLNEEISSIYLRYDTDKILSQITFWNDYSCVIEVYDLIKNKYLTDKRFEYSDIKELKDEFKLFLTEIEIEKPKK